MTPKNRPGRPSKTRADAMEDLVLTAARDSFCSRGVTGTSMDDIARAAGITKQTIYRRYASKMALIDAVVERDLEQLAASNTEEIGSPIERLHSRARRFFDFMTDDTSAEFSRFLRAEAAYCAEFRERTRSWHDIITNMMDMAIMSAQDAKVIQQGEVRHATHLLLDLMVGPGHAMAHGIHDPFFGMTPDGYFQQRWDIFLRIWGVDTVSNGKAHPLPSNDSDVPLARVSE